VIAKILFLVEQIRSRGSQIDNLRTPISVLLQPRTLKAVKGIRDSLATADHTLVLVVAKGAFVADAGEGGWAYVGVADGAFAVAFVAKAADGNSRLLAAHYEIAEKC